MRGPSQRILHRVLRAAVGGDMTLRRNGTKLTSQRRRPTRLSELLHVRLIMRLHLDHVCVGGRARTPTAEQ
jgi:hypothetical protein